MLERKQAAAHLRASNTKNFLTSEPPEAQKAETLQGQEKNAGSTNLQSV